MLHRICTLMRRLRFLQHSQFEGEGVARGRRCAQPRTEMVLACGLVIFSPDLGCLAGSLLFKLC